MHAEAFGTDLTARWAFSIHELLKKTPLLLSIWYFDHVKM